MVPYLQPLRKNTKCYNWLFLKANSGTKGMVIRVNVVHNVMELAEHTYSRQHHLLTDWNVFFFFVFLFLSRRQREWGGHWKIWFDRTPRGKNPQAVLPETRALFGFWLVETCTGGSVIYVPETSMKWPRQGSPPARQCLPRDRRGKHVPSTLHHSPPLHPRGRRPAETPPPRRRLFQGALPGERSLKLLGWVSGAATRPPCSPGTSPGRPPARPLARVPRPGRGPRRTACSLAAPRRPVRRCTPRSRRRPGACRRGDETAAVTKSGLGGSEEASAREAGRPA